MNMSKNDIFAKFENRLGPIGDYAEKSPGYFAFPKLEGEIGPRMKFRGKEKIIWSLNNYLGLANHPEVIRAMQQGAEKWGVGGGASHLVIGHSTPHHELEEALAADRHAIPNTGCRTVVHRGSPQYRSFDPSSVQLPTDEARRVS